MLTAARSGEVRLATWDEIDAAGAVWTIAEGKRADLLLLESNPLNDVSSVSRRIGVMIRGAWVTEAEIQGRLQTDRRVSRCRLRWTTRVAAETGR